ncbi:MAG: GGDEF domain-containing protein [Planctomycetota bacterium]|jgi:diguanylate cyclase (GGDEF)-like protein
MGIADTDMRKVLLIGDVQKAFLDSNAVRELPCEMYDGPADAVDAAAKNRFAAIAVVMSGLCSGLSSVLQSLRRVSHEAKIILLAQMYEEPVAMRLVGAVCNGSTMADDYLICPLEASRFYKAVVAGGPLPPAGAAGTVGVDVSTQTRMRQLEKLATEDDLTGLKNRRYLWEFSRQIIEYTRQEGGRVTLLLFDIDNLKSYNDVYGHLAGDEILKQVGVLMRRCCRRHDVVGRVGGDEFAVVFWDGPKTESAGPKNERRTTAAEHPKEAISVAKRFRQELERTGLHRLGPKGKGILTISGGLASFPRDGSDTQELFRQADRALLEAKRSGKNRIYLVGKPRSDISSIQ